MTTRNKIGSVLGLVCMLALVACGSMNTPANRSGAGTAHPQSTGASSLYSGDGVVESIEMRQRGNRGDTTTVVIGAGRGADAGNEADKRTQPVQSSAVYRITVRMDNGANQTLTLDSIADLRVADRVQLDNGVLRRFY